MEQTHKRAEENLAETFCGRQVTGLMLDKIDNVTCEVCRKAYYTRVPAWASARAALKLAQDTQ